MCEFGDRTLEVRLTNLGCLAYIESRGSPRIFIKIEDLLSYHCRKDFDSKYWCIKKTEDAPICALRLKMCGFLKFEDRRLKIGMLTLKI